LLEIGILLGGDDERARSERGVCIDPSGAQGGEDRLRRVIVHNINASLAALQADAHKRHDGGELFCARFVDQAEVIVRSQSLQRMVERGLVGKVHGRLLLAVPKRIRIFGSDLWDAYRITHFSARA